MSTRNERAERLISEAESGSLSWAARNERDELAGALHQIEMLENIVRKLCRDGDSYAAAVRNMGNEVHRLSGALAESRKTIETLTACSRAQGARIEQLQFDAAKGDDFDAAADELQRRIVAHHNRSTGAADALRGL